MTRPPRWAAVVAGLALPVVSLTATAGAAPSATGAHHRPVKVCTAGTTSTVACDAIRNDTVNANGTVKPNASPSGYGPADLRAAYQLPTSATTHTVAIVDAYNDPTAEADLGVYRSAYGLPACTTVNGCFKKVSQSGSTSKYPTTNGGWAQEIALDLDMVSAACPSCHILLVEASSASLANLGTAVNYAASHGASAISNSYGGGESSSDTYYDTKYFDHPGIAITASAGDSGYGAQYPAASQYVTAVGGTSLTKSSTARGWTETAWSGSGSGCSAYDPRPAWDTGGTAVCAMRAEADVSAVADPNTGVAVYDSTSYQGAAGWLVFGGTSVSSPIIASVYALAGDYGSPTTGAPKAYAPPAGSLNDVTSGSNGNCGTALCNATTGWDGPTGNGTPNGVGAF